jgi:rhodanese-related sulfurtransferase
MKRNLSATQLAEMIERHERVQLVDVRSANEYASGHVPGAMNMPLEETAARIDDLQRSAPVVLICHSGNRSEMACETIEPHHGDVYVLEGGTEAWQKEGRAVVRTTRASWPLERQVRFAAGLLVLLGALLGWHVHAGWFGLSAFVGAGLTMSGLTGWCGMGVLMAKMPWNRPVSVAPPAVEKPA